MRKNFGEFSNTMCRKARLHEEELTLQEKIEKICNDKDLFKKTSTILDYLKYISNVVQI